MNAGEWTGVAGLAFVALAFLADRILKPWRVRVLAEAEEKRAVALIQSEQMQAGLRVLTGTPADANQGQKQVDGLGGRMAAVEEGLKEIKGLLNGGGLGSQLTEMGAQVSQMDARQREHLDQAEASKTEITEDIRETRRFVAEAVVTLATSQQRLEEQVGKLDEKVSERLFTVEESERGLRATVHELGFLTDDDPDDAA